MNNNSRKERTFEEAWEIEIQGDVQTLCQIIKEAANELRLGNFTFDARQANSKTTNSFAWFNVFIIDTATMSKKPIGAVTLLSRGSNRIRLQVPPRSRWFHDGGLSADEIIMQGLIGAQYDKHFNQFIKSLEDRLRQQDLIETRYKKLWYEVKEFIASIIAKFLAEKSK